MTVGQANAVSQFVRSDDGVKTDLYRLLTAVHASEALRQLQHVEVPYDVARELREQFELREVHESLLRLASGYRNFSDQNAARTHALGLPNVNPYHDRCGTLDIEGNATEDLSLREACNKILHCSQIEHKYLTFESIADYSLSPNVVLKGTHRGKAWTCHLDILEFVDCLFYNYEA